MPPKDATPLVFSARDLQLWSLALQCTKQPVEVDYKKFAVLAELKNANSAKATFNAMRHKMEKMANGAKAVPSLTLTESADSSKTAAPAGGKKRKAAEKNNSGRDAEKSESEAETSKKPASKKKKKGRKAPITGQGLAVAASESTLVETGHADEDDGEIEYENEKKGKKAKVESEEEEDGKEVKMEE